MLFESTVQLVQEAAFLIPVAIVGGLMLLGSALRKKKANNPTVLDMNTPSIQVTRGGVVPAVYGRRRIGATYGWVGNRFALEEEVDSQSAKCFVAGTKVYTPSGPVLIEDIKKGDYVFALDKKGNRVKRKVTKTHKVKTQEKVTVVMDNGVIFRATPDHKMYLANFDRWHPLEDAAAGDTLLHFDGTLVAIKSINKTTVSDLDVYSLTVKRNHNFFAEGFLVHNDTGGGEITTTQIVYYESAWHILCAGPMSSINAMYEDGKGLVGGTPNQLGQGVYNVLPFEQDSAYAVFWGFSQAPHAPVDENGLPNIAGQPALAAMAQWMPVAGKGSQWPNTAFVWWNPKRLGTVPRWAQFEYDVSCATVQSLADAEYCSTNVYDEILYSDGAHLVVGPGPMLHSILALPYPLGLGLTTDQVDTNLISEFASWTRAEAWGMNILAQDGTDFQRVISEILQDSGAMLIENDGKVGPKIIRAIEDEVESAPLLTPEVLDPPLDEIVSSQDEAVSETVQMRFHQVDLGFRQQTLDVDNQGVSQFAKRRKTVTVDMSTVTTWPSATRVAGRRVLEGFASSVAIKVKGSRTLRDLLPGNLVKLPGVGQFRITNVTPHFDSNTIDLEMIADVYSRAEVDPWTPDDTVIPPNNPIAEPDLKQMFILGGAAFSGTQDCVVVCARVRANTEVGSAEIWAKSKFGSDVTKIGNQNWAGVGGNAFGDILNNPIPAEFATNDPDSDDFPDGRVGEGFVVGMHLNGDVPTKLLNKPYTIAENAEQFIAVSGLDKDNQYAVEIMAVESWETADGVTQDPDSYYSEAPGSRAWYRAKNVTRAVFDSTPVAVVGGVDGVSSNVINFEAAKLTPIQGSIVNGTGDFVAKSRACMYAGGVGCSSLSLVEWSDIVNYCRDNPLAMRSAVGGGISGNLATEYGGSLMNIAANGGLVEKTSGSATAQTPDEGYMGSIDGFYRIYQGDAESTSATSPPNEMICLQWRYNNLQPRGSGAGLRGYGVPIGNDDKNSFGQFKVVLEGAGIVDSTNGDRLPNFNETPTNDGVRWSTWIEFAEWKLNNSDSDYRAAANSVVTFALPRSVEKTLLAKYLNTDEETAVSNMLGLGGRHSIVDVASIKYPRCRFKVQHWIDGVLSSQSIIYVRAIGTDGSNRYDIDDWWS